MLLRDLVDHVIGVDTASETHAAVVVHAPTGAEEATTTAPANQLGYERLLEWANQHSAAGQRAWAIEGTGSYGAGLVRVLETAGEWVVEVDRPGRRRLGQDKSDPIDAAQAAREVLGRKKLAAPRARGDREATRALLVSRDNAVCCRTRSINLLKALLITAPDQLREQLRGQPRARLIATCARLHTNQSRDREWNTTITTLRAVAQRIQTLNQEITGYDQQLDELTRQLVPQLRNEPGFGPVVSAQALVSWSHPGRCHTEAAFAKLAGSTPIEASSGNTTRHRLNRGGDRQLNRALHTVILTRVRHHHEPTLTYLTHRTSQGKTRRETIRCLKRYLARHTWRLLQHPPNLPATATTPQTTRKQNESAPADTASLTPHRSVRFAYPRALRK